MHAHCPSRSRTRLPGTPEPMHLWNGANGVTLAGDSWGDPANPHLLLLHGGGQTRHAWRSTGREFAERGYYVVAFDARGHGDSGWAPDGDYSQDAFVQDLRCVVESLGSRRPALIGASLGGNTGLAAIGGHHVAAAALVLVDVVPQTSRAGFDRIQAFMKQKPDGFDSLQELGEAIGRYRGNGRPPSLDGLARNVRLGLDGRYHWHWDPRFLASRAQDFADRHARLSASARQLTIPTLLVRGGSSDVVSEEGVREFLQLCPHAEYVDIPSAGHMVTGDDNDIFGRSTMDFLSRSV